MGKGTRERAALRDALGRLVGFGTSAAGTPRLGTDPAAGIAPMGGGPIAPVN